MSIFQQWNNYEACRETRKYGPSLWKKNAVNRNWPEEVHALHLQKYFNHVFILNKLKNENKQMETKKVKTNTKN